VQKLFGTPQEPAATYVAAQPLAATRPGAQQTPAMVPTVARFLDRSV
jgi:hypothetical protein